MADHVKLHIAVFPWLAFGHIIPYLELAKLIAQKGHKVSFISTPRNIDRLPKLPPNLSPLINFVKIPLPHVHNLPENAEATADLPYNKVKYLKIAYDGLQQPIADFLQSSSPDWILFDFASYWLGPLASKLNVSTAYFSIFVAAILCYFIPPSYILDDRVTPQDFTVKPKWVDFETNVVIRLFEIQRFFNNLVGDNENTSDAYRTISTIKGCDAVVIRSSSDFEPDWLNLLNKICEKQIIEVGLLPNDVARDEDDEKWVGIKEWLDKQERKSVVYVAFGSETKPSQNAVTELAHGLELSKLPFFWVIIKQRGVGDSECVELPEGFEERTKGRGVVYTSWVPQLKIVSHDSVGGLLVHCGWSSVVEAIQFEKALVLLPLLADQGIICRLLEEKKMGYPIPMDERDGSFSRESVAESLRLVMVEEEGIIYRDKVKEMKGVFGGCDMQERYVDNLLGYFQTHKKVRS